MVDNHDLIGWSESDLWSRAPTLRELTWIADWAERLAETGGINPEWVRAYSDLARSCNRVLRRMIRSTAKIGLIHPEVEPNRKEPELIPEVD